MKAALATLCLTLAPVPCAAQLIYKYQRPDGQFLYSSRPMLGAKLIDSIEYTAPAAPSRRPDTSKSDAAGEARIRTSLSTLDAAWIETQVTSRALATAEARLAAGVTPQEGEVHAIASPAVPAAPADGGPMARAALSAGGPMGMQQGRRMSPDYVARLAALEADVAAARRDNQRAWERYNQLR